MRTYVWTGNKGEKVLSYDENFKKWQKSGESKTPGGVKIGVFRFIAVLLFCISTSPLWAADLNSAFIPCRCATFNSSDSDAGNCFSGNGLLESDKSRLDEIEFTVDEDRCKAVEGCKYSSGTSGGCTNGSSGTYTVDGNETLCSNTDLNYPNSAAGSWSEDQCYKSITLADNSEIKCRWYKSGTVLCATSNIESCQGAWGQNKESDGFCALNKAVINNTTAQSNSTNLSDAHNESNNVYLNTRNCNLFTTGTTQVPGVSGTAIWDNNKWNVDGCRKANQPITGAHCTGVLVAATNSNITDATTNIWTNTNKHFCTKCDAGYIVGGAGYYSQHASSDFCERVTGTGGFSSNDFPFYICNCAEPAASGYYTDGQQICNWSSANDDNQCKKNANYFGNYAQCCQKCGPGQTTDGGAASADDCHYTTQTRFCDAHGCFYLSDLGWDATNGYTWGGATSTTSGQ